MSQRYLRQKPRISYFEPEEPSLDEYVFCEKCADYVYEYCSIHGALLVIPDDKVPSKTTFPSFVPRAALTIPHVFLHLNYSSIPGAGLGVFTTLTLPSGVRFGPYRGERTNDVTSDYSWQIYDRNNKPSHVVDASDGSKSNWMRYVNCSRHWSEQNLVAYQYQGKLYYRTIKIIPRYTELMVFYGSEYANILEINLARYNSPKSYAQKFGAPAPKKPKFGLVNKKLQQALIPSEENGESMKLTTTNQTIANTVGQEISKNRINSEGRKSQSQKGASAPKKRKIELQNKKLQPENSIVKGDKLLEQNTENVPIGITSHAREPSNEVKKKTKSKKISLETTKPRFQKGMKSTNNKKSLENNLTSKESAENLNSEEAMPVDDKSEPNKLNFVKENISSNDERQNACNIPSKKQNEGYIKIQDAYYFCAACSYQGITKYSLEKHMKYHDMNRKFVCDICSYRFSTSFLLNNHKFHRHEIKSSDMVIHECNICNYTSTVENSLKIHLRTHTGEKPYSCDKCNFKSSQNGPLKIHLRTHTGEKPYSCDKCDYKSSRNSNLKIHLRTHTGVKPYSCDKCDYKSSRNSDLKIHLRTHTGVKPYSCDKCDYKSSRNSDLKIHLRTHTGVKPYSCDKCDYKSSRNSDLKIHLRTHTGVKPYSCDKCDFKSSQKGNLKLHLRTHTGEKPYSCDKCDYKSSRNSDLKIHLRTHTGVKPYSCDKCNFKSSQNGPLKIHLRTHTGEKPYSCDKCNFKSSHNGHLKLHLRTHTREKPYSCDKCNYKSAVKGNIKIHLRTHTGEKPYSCDKCNFKSSRNDVLKTHLRTHTAEKPYSCDICDYKCNQKISLNNHLKNKHLK